jgi:hypothetical protein
MPIMPDAALLAPGSHDQAHKTARAFALRLGASGRGPVEAVRDSRRRPKNPLKISGRKFVIQMRQACIVREQSPEWVRQPE